MPAYFTTVRHHKDGTHLVVRRQPWWTHLLSGVLIRGLVEGLCFLTGYRFCNCRLMTWAIRFSDRHTKEFEVPVTEDLALAYERWRGWRDWDTDEDDTTEKL